MPGLRIEVCPVAPGDLTEALSFLGEELRDGENVPLTFTEWLKKAVEKGDLEVLAARAELWAGLVGVAVLAFRPNVSAGITFASIEDLYVRTDARRRGVGRALLDAVGVRCRARGVSYVEVQTDDEAEQFYAALGYESEPDVRVLSRSYAL